MTRPVIFAFDLEATGIDVCEDRVVEIAWCVHSDGLLVDSDESYINPGLPIPAEATAVHGIDDEDVRRAPSLGDYCRDSRMIDAVADVIARGGYVTGYNAQAYDAPLLCHEMARAGDRRRCGGFNPAFVVDPLLFARDGLDLPDYQLATVWRRLMGATPPEDAHRAKVDVGMTLEVIYALQELRLMPWSGESVTLSAQSSMVTRRRLERERFGGWLREVGGEMRMARGKERGKALRDVDGEYMRWLLGLTDLTTDARETFTGELRRRGARI